MESAYSDLRFAGRYGGFNNLRCYAGATTRSAKEFLAKRDSYTLHKPRRPRFARRKTDSKGIADLYQIALVDVTGLSSHNDGSRYLLTCIDVFCKRAWAVQVRRKTRQNLEEAFEKILADGNCNLLQSDKGTEFLNSTFQSMLRRRGIKLYIRPQSSNDSTGLLKTKMFRYFTHANTRRYLDVLDDLLHSYNNTHHRSIGVAPSEVNADNEDVVRVRLYPLKPQTYRWKYAVGDRVRIGMQRQPFRKGYLGDWSEEIVEISTRLPTVP